MSTYDEQARKIIAAWDRQLITLTEMVEDLQKVANEQDQELRRAGAELARRRAAATTGYICKKCGEPSPMGVGYASQQPATGGDVDACACTYSRKPE